MLSSTDRHAVADALEAAETTRRPIDPLTRTWPGIDVTDAYEVQLLLIQRKVAAGALVRGHKVGLSSKAMQQMMGVDEPDYGHLLDTMLVAEGDPIPVAELCAPRVEVEVGFVLGHDLSGPGVTPADVLRATAFVLPAIEIIDSRIADWRIGLPDTIADNASSARVVVGGVATPVAGLDLRALGAVVRKNGDVVATGATGAVLANPVTAVAWLANTVWPFGVALAAGHLVLPGSCTRAVDVIAGDTIRAEIDVLGPVTTTFV